MYLLVLITLIMFLMILIISNNFNNNFNTLPRCTCWSQYQPYFKPCTGPSWSWWSYRFAETTIWWIIQNMVDNPQYDGWSKIKVVMTTASHMIHCDFNAMSTWGVKGARFSRIKRPERSWPLLRKLLSNNSKFSFFMSTRCPPPRLLSAYGDIVTRLQQRWTFQKTLSFTYFCFYHYFDTWK